MNDVKVPKIRSWQSKDLDQYLDGLESKRSGIGSKRYKDQNHYELMGTVESLIKMSEKLGELE